MCDCARPKRWVESGIGPEIEITPEQVYNSIEAAAEVGAEVFFIDASWYTPSLGNWWTTVGDWHVNRQRFPEGIEPFRQRVHEKGMPAAGLKKRGDLLVRVKVEIPHDLTPKQRELFEALAASFGEAPPPQHVEEKSFFKKILG